MSGIVGGRWCVVEALDTPGDLRRVSEWGTYDETLDELNRRLKTLDRHASLGMATCEACDSSDDGCDVCR